MIILLFFLFEIKHFICDFVLQAKNQDILLRKGKEIGWLKPLSRHCVHHGLGTFIITLPFTQSIIMSLSLSVLDFVLHGIIDRVKAYEHGFGRFTPKDKEYWILFGIDQMLHRFTYILLLIIMGL